LPLVEGLEFVALESYSEKIILKGLEIFDIKGKRINLSKSRLKLFD